jgi:hypothetical protein
MCLPEEPRGGGCYLSAVSSELTSGRCLTGSYCPEGERRPHRAAPYMEGSARCQLRTLSTVILMKCSGLPCFLPFIYSINCACHQVMQRANIYLKEYICPLVCPFLHRWQGHTRTSPLCTALHCTALHCTALHCTVDSAHFRTRKGTLS